MHHLRHLDFLRNVAPAQWGGRVGNSRPIAVGIYSPPCHVDILKLPTILLCVLLSSVILCVYTYYISLAHFSRALLLVPRDPFLGGHTPTQRVAGDRQMAGVSCL